MACIQGCKTEDVVVTFSGAAGTFPLTAFANDGSFIDFDEDETEVNREFDTNGDIYLAGNSWVNRPFSVTTYCTPEAIALDAAWRANGPVEFCGTANIITNCCTNLNYGSARLVSVEAPSIGTDIGTYTFSFEGIVD